MRAQLAYYQPDPEPHGPGREAQILAHVGLVRQVARRIGHFLPPAVDRDDLVQAGMIGLILAVDRFDPTNGALFTTYAEHRVRGAILDYLRESDWAPRSLRHAAQNLDHARQRLAGELGRAPDSSEVAERLGVTVDQIAETDRAVDGLKLLSLHYPVALYDDEVTAVIDVLDGSNGSTPLANAEVQQFRERLTQAIAALPTKSQTVLSLYHAEGLTMKEVGQVLGVTESRVSQIYSQTVKTLREWLEAHGADDPREGS